MRKTFTLLIAGTLFANILAGYIPIMTIQAEEISNTIAKSSEPKSSEENTYILKTAGINANTTPVESNISANGLLLHWKMDEPIVIDGTTLSDKIGNMNGLIVGNSFSTDKLDRGIHKIANPKADASTKTSSFIQTEDLSNTLNFGKDFTVSFWVYRDIDNLTGDYIIFQPEGGSKAPWLKMDSGGMLKTNKGVFGLGSKVNVEIPNREWTHLAIVNDNTLSQDAVNSFQGKVSVYMNGQYINTDSANYSSITQDLGSFRLGSDYAKSAESSAHNDWVGGFDDFRIYNKALSQQEIAALYNPNDIEPPTQITTIKTIPGDRQLKLEWINPTDNDLAGVNIYQVSGDKIFVSSHKTSYIYTGLENDTEYTFEIRAVDIFGNESDSVSIKAIPTSKGLELPKGVLVDDNFENGLFPAGWEEKLITNSDWGSMGSTGKVTFSDNRLRLELVKANIQPSIKKTFGPTTGSADGSLVINLEITPSRDTIRIPIIIRDDQGQELSKIYFGTGDKRINLVTATNKDNSETYVDILNGSILKGGTYNLSLMIDTINATISTNIMSNGISYAVKDQPLLVEAPLSGEKLIVDSLEIQQAYMYSNNGFIYIDNVYVAESDIDTMVFRMTIDEANKLVNSVNIGEGSGQYLQSVVDKFKTFIKEQENLLSKDGLTQVETDNAIASLKTEMDIFSVASNPLTATISIDTSSGHEIAEGASGANVRNVDQAWHYDSPEFIEATARIDPGYLRYFSGTVSDSFNMRTGLYEKEWVEQFASGSEYDGQLASYQKTYVKGPQLLSTFYQDLLGPLGIKLIITVNAFTDTPESIRAIAKFCKDNHIEVEMYQFCNEPYFFDSSSNGSKFHFNNGLDYAKKMEPYAEAIKEIDPQAKLALSYSWDTNNGSFRKSVETYPNPYWDIVTIHSYAAYGPNETDMEIGMKQANAALIYATSPDAMKEQFKVSWNNAPVSVTEHGLWNGTLSHSIYGGIYSAEYVLRMTDNPNVSYLGVHSLNTHTFLPKNSYNQEMLAAYDLNTDDDPSNNIEDFYADKPEFGIDYHIVGESLQIANEAINNSTYTWDTSISDSVKVDSFVRPFGGSIQTSKLTSIDALFSQAYRGDNGKNYLVVTNKSDTPHKITVEMDGEKITSPIKKTFIASNNPATSSVDIIEENTNNPVNIPAYSVVRLEWDQEEVSIPVSPRIYKTEIGSGCVTLNWWERDTADNYTIYYGTDKDTLIETKTVTENESYTINGLEEGKTYYFAVTATNKSGESKPSNVVDLKISVPDTPQMDAPHSSDSQVTVFWQSVPGASTYEINYGTSKDNLDNTVNANNTIGYTIESLKNDSTYYFEVVAKNGAGKSNASNIVSATPKKYVPVAPHKLLVKLNKTSAVLTWIPYQFKEGVETYEIRRSTTSDVSEYEVLEKHYEGTSYTDPLPGEGEYYYTIVAKNDNAKSFYHSNVGSIIYDTSKPAAITNVKVTAGDKKLTISWQDPADKDLASIRVYNEDNIKIAEAKSGDEQVTIDGLESGTNYTFKLFSIDNHGKKSSEFLVSGSTH